LSDIGPFLQKCFLLNTPTREPTNVRYWHKADICGVLARALYKGMSEHKVTLKWERGGAEFSYQK
ncbi:MAG: hypothetical protein WBW99_20250, partial [Pseudolabrys sp.]